MARKDFAYTPPAKGRVVQTRFGLRRESETKKSNEKPSIFSYGERGRGPNGESSN